jgi:PII-like signaling protein
MDMSLFTDEYMLNTLQNEIQVMIELFHAHIVQLLECITFSGSTVHKCCIEGFDS